MEGVLPPWSILVMILMLVVPPAKTCSSVGISRMNEVRRLRIDKGYQAFLKE